MSDHVAHGGGVEQREVRVERLHGGHHRRQHMLWTHRGTHVQHDEGLVGLVERKIGDRLRRLTDGEHGSVADDPHHLVLVRSGREMKALTESRLSRP